MIQKLGVDEETGLEILAMERTYKDSTPEDVNELEPQIAVEKEPAAAQRKDPNPSVSDLEKEDTTPPPSNPKPNTEYDPQEVVYDDTTGAVKYDGLKPRVDLIPSEVIFAMGEMFRHGAEKYSDRNWEKGMNWSRVFGSTMRHLWAWWGGEEIDPDSKRPHLYAAACCIAMLIAYRERKAGKDDRFISNDNSKE